MKGRDLREWLKITLLEILEIEVLNYNDNLFNCGMSSFDTMELISALNEEFNVHVPAFFLYKCQDIESMASYLENLGEYDE